MRTLAMLSLHTSPLSQPGTGDSGGMNVYVRELAGSLAQAGIDCTVYVRRTAAAQPPVVDVEPGLRVVHIDAGAHDLAKEALPATIEPFTEGVLDHIRASGGADTIHANYWLSGVAGHRLKHELDLPLVSTFHTLDRVKAESGDDEAGRRAPAEAEVIACSDVITASCPAERSQLIRLYGAPPDRIELVPPGVVHAFFSPGDQRGARMALALGAHPVLLFVGRIQPLKGLDVAVRALAAIERDDAVLVVVGGPSGPDGERELARTHELASDLGVADRIRWVDPQEHHVLSTYYRASDVVLVPSRSESFGLVALEAGACGVPVVAAAVGGLRTLVEHGRTGFLVDGRDPEVFAAYATEVLDNPGLAASLGAAAAARARGFTWSTTAARLRRLYADLSARTPVACPAA